LQVIYPNVTNKLTTELQNQLATYT